MESKNYLVRKIGETPTGVPVYIVVGVTLDEILRSSTNPFTPLNRKIYELELEFSRGKDVVYRAFKPIQFRAVILYGTDRTPDYVSPWDRYKSDAIYAGPLEKAMESAAKRFNEEGGLACLAAYDEEKLEKVDFYAYRAKTSFKDALLGIICLSDSEFSDLHESVLSLALWLANRNSNNSKELL